MPKINNTTTTSYPDKTFCFTDEKLKTLGLEHWSPAHWHFKASVVFLILSFVNFIVWWIASTFMDYTINLFIYVKIMLKRKKKILCLFDLLSAFTSTSTSTLTTVFFFLHLLTEPGLWVWIWSHVWLDPVCVHCHYGLQHHLSYYYTFWWVVMRPIQNHVLTHTHSILLHSVSLYQRPLHTCKHTTYFQSLSIVRFFKECLVCLQVSCTCCWSVWWTNTTCILPICRLAWTTRSTSELSIKLSPHPSSV